MAGPSREQIARAVEAFINAQTWDESKRTVEAQREKLLTDAADQFLAFLLEQYRGDANATSFLQERRTLLVRCRRSGIEAAFAEYLQLKELQTLLSEIVQITSPREMSRRIALCRAALQLVNDNVQPQIWGLFTESSC